MQLGNEGWQPGQAPEGGVPSVGPGRGGKPLTGVDGPVDGWMDGNEHRFLGGCLRAAEAGALGDLPDASKRHQGPGGPYIRHSKEFRDDMPWGTTECPRCSRPGDLLKQQGGNSTLGFLPGGAGG